MTAVNATIASIEPKDLSDLDRMAGEFSSYLRAMGDADSAVQLLSADRIREAAFGADPVLFGYIARIDDAPGGYLLYAKDYNTDFGVRVFHVCDLFVRDHARGLGIGRLLMDRAARDCRSAGGKRLEWEVWRPNVAAHAFYRAIGGMDDLEIVRMHLDL